MQQLKHDEDESHCDKKLHESELSKRLGHRIDVDITVIIVRMKVVCGEHCDELRAVLLMTLAVMGVSM